MANAQFQGGSPPIRERRWQNAGCITPMRTFPYSAFCILPSAFYMSPYSSQNPFTKPRCCRIFLNCSMAV